jgi:Ca2+-binding RTX toxin-like protein
MPTHSHNNVIFRAVLGLVTCIGLSSTARYVQAATNVSNPFGTAATAYINYDPDDGGNWINWQENATGNCSFTSLGTGGFSDDFNIFASNSGDTIVFLEYSQSFAFCGYSMNAPKYNGHYADLYGGTGNDRLSTGAGDTYIHGGTGDDILSNDGGAALYLTGDDGNDTLLFGTSNGGTVQGGAGNDCLAVSTAATNCTMSCGDGTDQWGGPGTMPADCETNSWQCCPGLIC